MTTDLERVLTDAQFSSLLAQHSLSNTYTQYDREMEIKDHDAALRALLREALEGWDGWTRLGPERENARRADIRRAVFGEENE